MAIRFACPNCGADYSIHDQAAGTEIGCSECGQRLVVPAAPPSSAGPVVAALVVIYIPPSAEVTDYRARGWEPSGEERVHVREDVHFVYQERGAFASAFGRTMGEGCGCLVLAFVAVGIALAAVIFLAALSHPPKQRSGQATNTRWTGWAACVATSDRPGRGPAQLRRAPEAALDRVGARAETGGAEPEVLTVRAAPSDLPPEPPDRNPTTRTRDFVDFN